MRATYLIFALSLVFAVPCWAAGPNECIQGQPCDATQGLGPSFQTYTVSTLPTCNSSLLNRTGVVTDNVATCNPGVTLSGGGGNRCNVVCDGNSTWSIVNLAGQLPLLQGGTNTFFGAGVLSISAGNKPGVGTILNGLVKLTADNPSLGVCTSAGDTSGVIGIATTPTSTVAGNLIVLEAGLGQCLFDGVTTAGDYVGISPTTACECRDLGNTFPANQQVIGRVATSGCGPGAPGCFMTLFPGEQLRPSSTTNTFASFTVSTLPTCNSSLVNRSATVTDNTAVCTPGGVLTGSGSNHCNVVCDGVSAWSIVNLAPTQVLPFAQGGTASNVGPQQYVLNIGNSGAYPTSTATPGTLLNGPAKLSPENPSKAACTEKTDSAGIIGIVTAGAGTTGAAIVTQGGIASCTFDSAGTTAGDYVVNSAITACTCHDAGASFPANGLQVIGRVASTNATAGLYVIELLPGEQAKATLGSGPIVVGLPSPAPTPNAGTFVCSNTSSFCSTTLTTNGETLDLALPADVTKSALTVLEVLQDGSGGHGVVWNDNHVTFYSQVGTSVDDEPWYGANTITQWLFAFDPIGGKWARLTRSPTVGSAAGGNGISIGAHSPPSNLFLLDQYPGLIIKPGQWNQVSGDNAGPPSGFNLYSYLALAVSYVCNTDNSDDAWLQYKCNNVNGDGSTPTLGGDLWAPAPMRIMPGQCLSLTWIRQVGQSTFFANHFTGANWVSDGCAVNSSKQLRVTQTEYTNQTSGSW